MARTNERIGSMWTCSDSRHWHSGVEEQEAVIRLIDAVMVKHQVESSMQPVGKARGHAKGVV
jgi:hypothetical protein